jgi:hypothetical protein
MSDAAEQMRLETVYTVNAYYDGPERGVANFDGAPHAYERLSERHDGKPEDYRLSPIDAVALEAVLEDWKLYLKWEASADIDKRGVSGRAKSVGCGPSPLRRIEARR